MADKTDRKPLLKMFSDVPPRYDMLNRLLTLRLDELWRAKTVKRCLEGKPQAILDLCTGTGDLAIRIARKCNYKASIKAYDFSENMLEIAKEKASKKSPIPIEFVYGDVSDMPFSDNEFDVIGISFAFRNLTYHNQGTPQYLKEILRCLKPGGRFVIVETSQPSSAILKSLLHFYYKYIVSALGGRLSGHKAAYHYLSYSARNFYSPAEVQGLLKEAGFSIVDHKALSMDIAALYTAIK